MLIKANKKKELSIGNSRFSEIVEKLKNSDIGVDSLNLSRKSSKFFYKFSF